jgi:hypothetical protein
MIVRVGSILFDYTGGRARLEASGGTVGALLDDLERRHPGMRFRIVDEQGRIRPHIRLFLDQSPVADLGRAVGDAAELHVLAALSGG